MGALITLIPTILALLNNPAVVALMPLIQQLLSQLGTQSFPGVDPNKAGAAGADLFNTTNTKWAQTALNILGTRRRLSLSELRELLSGPVGQWPLLTGVQR